MNPIIEFIHRRFPIDCNWLNGNCYYFARILQDRFGGTIWYDLVEGHFLFYYDNNFYDWTGLCTNCNIDNLVEWSTYNLVDPLHYNRIVRDVIN